MPSDSPTPSLEEEEEEKEVCEEEDTLPPEMSGPGNVPEQATARKQGFYPVSRKGEKKHYPPGDPRKRIDKPSPAAWRTQKTKKGKIKGMVRRKGEKNSKNWGFVVQGESGEPEGDIHQMWDGSPLPDRSEKALERRRKADEKRIEGAVKAAKKKAKAKKKKKSSSCTMM